MLSRLYAKWMYSWETALTTRDTNRIVRPLEWGFDWLEDFSPLARAANPHPGDTPVAEDFARMTAVNRDIVARADEFFGYETPTDFRLERRHPQLYPTNVRPETLEEDAELKRQAETGEIEEAEFLRFTSPIRTRYPENDIVNARWYPAHPEAQREARFKGLPVKPRQAMIIMPQWNADAFSHNALCTLFNSFGISCLRLSKPYHDVRRPAELERSDYAVSSNVGRTTEACRQAVVDIRSCIDWLESQGYEHFGVLGTSLGSCYAFIAAAFDQRLQVCAFNHASTWFGDVVWAGQSTRHIRAAFEQAGLTQDQVREIFSIVSPMSYMDRFAQSSSPATPKRVLVVHATYDLTFPLKYSLDVLTNFDALNIDYVSKVLPCGHYTTGETPYKYIDGWYLGSFIYKSFKHLAQTKTAAALEPQATLK
ncbi:alpha/beta hydrolase family protein [Tunturibacter empetritectus]|uniref:Dienelactone hydrolase n=1 Tax=Tunturiibacter lichenicola TaxID=2051959 RepID=A0A7W8N4T3_9BACT|nr:alpha/beta hydrolase family protein [Edaphobacter lichenicola]MBB5344853.1 dienelactone hydrolase [Edaphobacter lichenicola]